MNNNTIFSRGVNILTVNQNNNALQLYAVLEGTGYYRKNGTLTNEPKMRYYAFCYKDNKLVQKQKINLNRGKEWTKWRKNIGSNMVKEGGILKILDNNLYSNFIKL